MGMLRDMAGEVVEILTEKEEAENVRACMKWMEENDDSIPEGWKSLIEEEKPMIITNKNTLPDAE